MRLLSSGPRAGLNEINLPVMQPGSSIMPGKVNPVIPEVVNQIAFKVIGNDLTVTLAAEAGQLELNVMEPVIVQSLFESIEMLINGMMTLKSRCIDGITVNAVCPTAFEHVEPEVALDLVHHGQSWNSRKGCTPQDIAEAVSFLASEHGRFVTGSLLHVRFHV